MDVGAFTLMRMARMKMDWIAQRQKVLAQNLANANTPNYRARDLRELDFGRMAREAIENPVRPALTRKGHARARSPETGPFRQIAVRKTFETSIDRNPVVLEEELQKLASGRSQYRLSLELIKKNMKMLKTAIGSR